MGDTVVLTAVLFLFFFPSENILEGLSGFYLLVLKKSDLRL